MWLLFYFIRLTYLSVTGHIFIIYDIDIMMDGTWYLVIDLDCRYLAYINKSWGLICNILFDINILNNIYKTKNRQKIVKNIKCV